MNEINADKYDRALEVIKSSIGPSYEHVSRQLYTRGHEISTSSIYRWFRERSLPNTMVVELAEMTFQDQKDRQKLVKALLPKLSAYL